MTRTPTSRSYWILLAAVTALTAAIPVILAGIAWRTGTRHREAAERVLRDYALVAGNQFRQAYIGRMYPAIAAIFSPLGSPRVPAERDGLPPPSALRRARDVSTCADCGIDLKPAWYFRYTFADSALVTDGEPTAHQEAWIAAELNEFAGLREARDWEHASVIDTLGPAPTLVILTMRWLPDGSPRSGWGFAIPLDSLVRSVVRPILSRVSVLPLPARTAPSNDSVVTLSLQPPDGSRSIALNPPRGDSPYWATLHGGLYFGGWELKVALDPVTAPPYLIGAIPQSRPGLLVTLVLLTCGLAGTIAVLAWRASRLARAREEFVANVSHELRTPLAQILLFSETLSLRRMTAPAEVQGAAAVITGETRRLIELVERVLAFGRGRRMRGPARTMQDEGLAPLIEESVAAFAPIAGEGEVTLRTTLDDVTAPVDRAGVRQVIMNLLDNAVKFGPRGQTVTVGLRLDGGEAVVLVDDEGPGIPRRDRTRVWEPFRRLERDVESRVAGSGLGLAVVRDVVKEHGGRVGVEDAPGGGARIVVRFPQARRSATGELACAS